METKDEEAGVPTGRSASEVMPGRLGDVSGKRHSGGVWEIRFWRVRQFMWGWCWGAVFDIAVRLVSGEGTYLLCVVMGLMAGLAHWYGRSLNTPVFVIQR